MTFVTLLCERFNSTKEPVWSCFSITLSCRGCVTQRVTGRGRDLGCSGQCWCLCNGPWVAAGSLRSLSLGYHCCMHCWSERKVDSLILPVGCIDWGKTAIPHCYVSDVLKWRVFFFFLLSCLMRLALCAACELGVSMCSLGEAGGGLGWGTLSSVFWQGHYSVWMELKESFSERGSVKGMCRMRPGSNVGKRQLRNRRKKKKKDTLIWNYWEDATASPARKKFNSRGWGREKSDCFGYAQLRRRARTGWSFTVVKIETRMEVERLRERLIRELRREGSQEGKRQRR